MEGETGPIIRSQTTGALTLKQDIGNVNITRPEDQLYEPIPDINQAVIEQGYFRSDRNIQNVVNPSKTQISSQETARRYRYIKQKPVQRY